MRCGIARGKVDSLPFGQFNQTRAIKVYGSASRNLKRFHAEFERLVVERLGGPPLARERARPSDGCQGRYHCTPGQFQRPDKRLVEAGSCDGVCAPSDPPLERQQGMNEDNRFTAPKKSPRP